MRKWLLNRWGDITLWWYYWTVARPDHKRLLRELDAMNKEIDKILDGD